MFRLKSQAHSLVFIFAALCVLVSGLGDPRKQQFYLHTNDRLCLDIDNILPSKELLNRLKISAPADLEIVKPNSYQEQEAPDFIPKMEPSAKLVNVSHFGKKILLLLKQGENNLVVIKDFDVKTKTSKEDQVFAIAPDSNICESALMDEERIYTACFSKTEKIFQFCSLNHIDQTTYVCGNFDFGLEFKSVINTGAVRLDFYNGQDENKLWVLYYAAVQPAYKVLNKFYLLESHNKQSLMDLHDDVEILKISIILYNQLTKEATLMIMVNDKGVRSLRHYKIADAAFVETEEKKFYKEIKRDISDFIFKDNTLIIIQEPKDKPVTITDVDLKEFSFLEFEMPNQKSLREVRGTNNFFAFDTLNDDKRVEYSIFDIRNHRFLRIDDLGNIDLGTKWIIVPIGYSNYFFRFQDGKATFFEVHPFQNVCVTLKESLSTGDRVIDFQIGADSIFQAIVAKKEYDFIMKPSSFTSSVSLTGNEHEERQVYLQLKGNNMEFSDDSPVYFFHSVMPQRNEEDPDDGACILLKATIRNKSLITVCKDGKITISKDFWLDNYAETYSFELRTIFDTKFEWANIDQLKILFSQFLVIFTKDRKIYYANLEAKRFEIFLNSQLTVYKDCFMQKQHFICEDNNGGIDVIYSFKKANELEFLFERRLSLSNPEFQSIVVSSYLKDVVYYVRQSFHSEKYHLIQQSRLIDEKLNIGNLQLSPSTITFEIAENELIIINDPTGNIQVSAFVENSLVDYPFKNQKTFRELVDYTFIEEAKIFCLLYCSIDGKLYLYVAQPSLEVYSRVIKDTIVGDFTDGAKIEAHYVSKTLVLFFVYSTTGADYQYSFIYFLNSPIYSIAADSNAQTMLFRLNGKRYSRSIERVVKDSTLDISSYLLRIDDPDQETILFDIERNKNVLVKGDLLDVYDALPGDNVSFIPRVNFKNRAKVRMSSSGLDSRASNSLMIDGEGYVLFYDDFFYKNNEGQTNKDSKDCKRVDIVTDDPNLAQLFFCKDKKSGKNVITNLSDVSIVLEQSSKKLKKFKAIKDDKDFYLACVTGSQKRIYFYKFIQITKSFKLEFLKTFTPNDFFIDGEVIDNFFMFKNVLSGKIVFLIHQLFGTSILAKEFDISSNVFDKQKSQEIALKDPDTVNVHELYCIQVGKQANCFARSDRFIYDILLDTSRELYRLNVQAKYRFTEQFNIDHKINFAITEKYMAVLMKKEQGYDALIYQRGASKDVKSLFGSVRIKDQEKIARIAMLDNQATGLTSLYVALFHDKIDESNSFFKNLSIDEYHIGTMSLQISKESTGYKRVMELNFLSDNGETKKVFLEVILSNNYRNFLLMITLIILIIVLIGAISVVMSVYHQNKKLRIELEANNPADNSAFLDRTHLQI